MINDLRGKPSSSPAERWEWNCDRARICAPRCHGLAHSPLGQRHEDAVRKLFADEKLPTPQIIQPMSRTKTRPRSFFEQIKKHHDHVEAFISNVSFGLVVESLDGYALRSLFRSIEYSTWPMYQYSAEIKKLFGKWPRYVVGL